MLYILHILNTMCQTYFSEKKRGSSNIPQCFSPTQRLGCRLTLVALRCSSYMNIFSTVRYLGNFSFSSNSLHPFLQLPLPSREHSSTPRNRFTPGLHPALRAAAFSYTEPLHVSGLTKTFVRLSLYLSIKVRRSCSLYLEAPSVSYILIKYLQFQMPLNFHLFEWLSNFLLWKDKISVFFLSKLLEHVIYMVSFSVFFMLSGFFTHKRTCILRPREKRSGISYVMTSCWLDTQKNLF